MLQYNLPYFLSPSLKLRKKLMFMKDESSHEDEKRKSNEKRPAGPKTKKPKSTGPKSKVQSSPEIMMFQNFQQIGAPVS